MACSSDLGLGSCKYDVFISFRGADTRNNFISHLYDALIRKQINVYKDDVSLQKGDDISPALLKAIESSKISLAVLSKDYATSGWCLDELVHILKCKRERAHIVLPVFYGVDPSAVRKQQGIYAPAFVEHEKRFKNEMERVLRWRSALDEAANLSGWVSCQNRGESELVEEIVQVIVMKLCTLSSTSYGELNRNLVGIEARCRKIESLLRLDSPEVRVVGIWGMGGIGKSTLAEVIQKRFASRFESSFFIDVSNALKRCELRDINEKFIASLLKDKDVDMNNPFTDLRLRRTQVLVVLDNVDDVEQLQHLIGFYDQTKNRFGEGSRIIITSRDMKLLVESADDIYEVDALRLHEATQLFYQFAFRRDSSKIIDYVQLSKSVVDYAGGNPLALKVLGSHLHLRSVKEWESALSKLRKAPHEKVQKVLKLSYDGLDHVEQSIFLDISCYLEGEARELIQDVLDEDSHIAISVLIERSLISISNSYICMHDLIQAMAWEVVREESLAVGKPIRLRDAQDIYSVLIQDKGARVEGMCLDLSRVRDNLCISSTAFEALENLRLLKIYESKNCDQKKFVYFDQGLDCLSSSLRYIHWESYPLKSLPSRFNPQNLVKLYMRGSKLEKLWDGVQHLGNLKHFDLSFSSDMVELPDLSLAPKLTHLDLNYCESLRQLPKISGSLIHLNLFYCKNLASLPTLPRNVRTLYLAGCRRLSTNLNFPPVWQMLLGLDSLTDLMLELSCCSISHIRDSFNLLSSLGKLELWGIGFERIPSGIKHMYNLKHLCVSYCRNLQSLSDLPSSIIGVEARVCESLKMFSVCGLTLLRYVRALGCKSLEEFSIDEHGCPSWDLSHWENSALIYGKIQFFSLYIFFDSSSKLNHSSQYNILTLFQGVLFGRESASLLDLLQRVPTKFDNPYASACYSGNEIPNWFTYQSEGSSIHVNLGQNFISIAASVVYEIEGIKPKDGHHELRLKMCCGAIDVYERWHLSIPMIYSQDEIEPHMVIWHCNSDYFLELKKLLRDDAIEAAFEFEINNLLSGAEIKIKKCGIHIINLDEVQEFQTKVTHLPRGTKPKLELLEDSSND